MGAVGTSADNALAESLNATLKRETLAGAYGWDSPGQARREVFAWITRYNTGRRHSARKIAVGHPVDGKQPCHGAGAIARRCRTFPAE